MLLIMSSWGFWPNWRESMLKTITVSASLNHYWALVEVNASTRRCDHSVVISYSLRWGGESKKKTLRFSVMWPKMIGLPHSQFSAHLRCRETSRQWTCQEGDPRSVLVYKCFHNIHVNKTVPLQLFSYIYLGELAVF